MAQEFTAGGRGGANYRVLTDTLHIGSLWIFCLTFSVVIFLLSFIIFPFAIHSIPQVRDWWHIIYSKHIIKEHGRDLCLVLLKSADWGQSISSWMCSLAQYSASHIHEITYIIGHITDQYELLLAIFPHKPYHQYLKFHHYVSNHVVNSHIYTGRTLPMR